MWYVQVDTSFDGDSQVWGYQTKEKAIEAAKLFLNSGHAKLFKVSIFWESIMEED